MRTPSQSSSVAPLGDRHERAVGGVEGLAQRVRLGDRHAPVGARARIGGVLARILDELVPEWGPAGLLLAQLERPAGAGEVGVALPDLTPVLRAERERPLERTSRIGVAGLELYVAHGGRQAAREVIVASMSQRLDVVDHPVLADRLAVMRDRNTSHGDFRQALFEASAILAVEAARGLPVTEVEVETPLERTTGSRLPTRDHDRAGAARRTRDGRRLPAAPPRRPRGPRRRVPRRGGAPPGRLLRAPAARPGRRSRLRGGPDARNRRKRGARPRQAEGGRRAPARTRVPGGRPRGSRGGRRRRTPTSRSGPPPWTASSTRTHTSAPAWATRATGCSGRSRRLAPERQPRIIAITPRPGPPSSPAV